MTPWGISEIGCYRPRFGLDEGLAKGLGADPWVRLAAPDEDAWTLAGEAIACLTDADPATEVALSMPTTAVEPRAFAALVSAAGAIASDAGVVPLAPEAQAADVLRLASALKPGAMAALVDLPARRSATSVPGGDVALALRFGEPRVAKIAALASRNVLAFDRWDSAGAPKAEIDARFVEETLVSKDGKEVLTDLLARGSFHLEDLAGVVVSCAVPISSKRLATQLGVAHAWQALPAETIAGTRSAETLALAITKLAEAGPESTVAVLELGWGGRGVLLTAGPEIEHAAQGIAQSAAGELVRRYDYRSWQVSLADSDVAGPWTSPAKLRRETADLLGLVGTACEECEGVSYPYQGTCELCGSYRVVRRQLQRKGTVVTQAVDHLFGGPSGAVQMAVVDLDGGGRFFGQVVQDANLPLAVGDRTCLVQRRLHQANGLPHYFWKVDLDES